MINKLKVKLKDPAKALENWKSIKPDKELLKKLKKVTCTCKRNKKTDGDRINYGVNRCDTYAYSSAFGNIFANSLFYYIAVAKPRIVRNDWAIIEKHAQAIRDYAEADSWDKRTTVGEDAMTRMYEYELKEVAWREAMFWLTENWHSLWW